MSLETVLIVTGILVLALTGLHTIGIALIVTGTVLLVLELLFFGAILSWFRRM